jgi:chemotaxis protein MotB
MEFSELEKSNARLAAEKEEFQRTMEEMMDSYARLVEEANARKNDYTASMGILETEMATLRQQFQAQKTDLTSLRASHTALQAEHTELMTLSSEQLESLEGLRGENEALRNQYDKLHRQAQEKLSASAEEYRKVLARAAERDLEVQSLQADLDSERSRAQAAEEIANQLNNAAAAAAQRMASVESAGEVARSEVAELRASLRSSAQALAETQARCDEAQQVGQRYKEQILEHREKMRAMDEASSRSLSLERESASRQAELAQVTRENQQLKSQLFDSFQMEKALKAQLAAAATSSSSSPSSGGGAAAAAASAAVLSAAESRASKFEAELASLRATLATKDNEHKELMHICTDLISQVETLKAAQGQGQQQPTSY